MIHTCTVLLTLVKLQCNLNYMTIFTAYCSFFRYTIYSPKDGQPCMDHDRQTGEVIISDTK